MYAVLPVRPPAAAGCAAWWGGRIPVPGSRSADLRGGKGGSSRCGRNPGATRVTVRPWGQTSRRGSGAAGSLRGDRGRLPGRGSPLPEAEGSVRRPVLGVERQGRPTRAVPVSTPRWDAGGAVVEAAGVWSGQVLGRTNRPPPSAPPPQSRRRSVQWKRVLLNLL